MSEDEIAALRAQLAAAQAETAAANARAAAAARPKAAPPERLEARQTGPLYVGQVRALAARIGDKRGLSFTGLTAQFPQTFYLQQLEPLLHMLCDGTTSAFIRANAEQFEVKVRAGDNWVREHGTAESMAEAYRIADLLDAYGPTVIDDSDLLPADADTAPAPTVTRRHDCCCDCHCNGDRDG